MREMKDSGVEWIGEIPSSWKVVSTKFLFQILSGATPDSSIPEYWDGDITWITPADYKTKDVYVDSGRRCLSKIGFDSCSTSMISAGSIIFSKRAPIGSVAINQTDLCTNQGCLSCVSKGNSFAKYYYYVMSVATEHYELLGSGTTFKEISATNFGNFALPYPDYQIQIEISNYLDGKCAQVGSLISNVQAQIEKLKAYKQSLIAEVVTKGLDPTVPMKDSGVEWIGKIPAHWEIGKLRTRTKMLIPMRDKPEDLGGPIPWVRIEDYSGKYITASKEQLGVSAETVTAMNLKIYPVGTVLCTSSCDLGKCAIVGRELVSNQRFIGIIPQPELSSDYLYYLMLSNAERLNMLSTGSIQANLSRVSFEQLLVQFPPIAEQKAIAEYLDKKCEAADHLIAIKQTKIEKLEQYKRSLIYEYVTGKKEVC